MKRGRSVSLVLFASILTVLVLFGSQLQVRTVMAVPSFTNGMSVPLGANTCAASGCHSGSAPAGNSATVTGFPAGMTYSPGTPIPLTVTINDTSTSRFGFELTSRLVSNTALAAGTFTAGTNSKLGTNMVPVVQGTANSSTFTMTWTPPTTAAGNVTFYLSGLAGSCCTDNLYTASYTLAPTAVAKPDFSLSATNATVVQGATGTSTLTVTPVNAFAGTIALSASGLPSGVTLSPASVTGSGALTLTATSTATTGTVLVTLTGTSGTLTHTATFNVTVNAATVAKPDFSISASPSSVTITQGASGTSTITIAPLNAFSGSVALSIPGLPTGVTASFSPTSATTSSTLTLSASSTAAPMMVGLTVTGISGALTHTATVNLTVNASTSGGSSSLTATPTSLTFNFQGGGTMPPSQKVTLGATGGPLTYSAATSGGPWLSASPTGGSAPGSFMASVNPTGMSTGSYVGAIQVNATGGKSATVHVTLNITSGSNCDDGCGGGSSYKYATPFVNDPSSSGTLTAQWIDLLGMPTGRQSSTGDPGLVLSKDATAPSGTQAGASISNVQGPLTELGFDYREGGQCTATSPRFIVVTTDSVTHIVGGCSKGTLSAAPVAGWKRVRFNLTDSAQTSPVILPGDSVSSITLIMDQGPETGPTAAGGLVIIDNIDVNGTFAGRGSSSSTIRFRRD